MGRGRGRGGARAARAGRPQPANALWAKTFWQTRRVWHTPAMPHSGRTPLAVQSVARPVTLIESQRLARRLGVELTLASETFQHTGSFKFRAAYHLAANVPQPHLIAASSGNFGQAMAYA